METQVAKGEVETGGSGAMGESGKGESGDRGKWSHEGKWRQGKVAT